jgi:hypothetical protein
MREFPRGPMTALLLLHVRRGWSFIAVAVPRRNEAVSSHAAANLLPPRQRALTHCTRPNTLPKLGLFNRQHKRSLLSHPPR